MSDRRVRSAIERMEAWIGDPAWEPEPEELESWNRDYRDAVAGAEKGEGWTDLVARAHALGRQLEVRLQAAVRKRDEIKAELDAQERGNRALAGYGASAR